MTVELKDAQVSLRLPAQLKEQVETYSKLVGRTKSYVAMEALGEYLAWRSPQIEDLEEAIAAADRGEFATEEEVEALFEKLSARYRAAVTKAAKPAARRRR
ncbi:MAG: hypothetical protein LW847_14970 [Burkholderiales bacterium]|jgi:RHH-type rel operon transcriptional repressor/antitoxin RelB|nr:hypothetical protein [Burkholderiales bacterium]